MVAVQPGPKSGIRTDVWVEKGPGKPAEGDKKAVSATWVNELATQGYPTMEGVNNLFDMFDKSVHAFPNNNCLGWRPALKGGKAGPYEWMTYKQVGDKVAGVASAMASLGLGFKDRCGVYGANSPEWMITLQACNRQGLWCVPLYDTLGEDAVEYIIRHADVPIVFTAGDKFPGLVKALEPVKKIVKAVVVWGKIDPNAKKVMEINAAAGGLGIKVYGFEEFVNMGKAKPVPAYKATKADLCTIMYTSGTTGNPKGVMLSHGNLLATVAGCLASMDQIGGMYDQRFTPQDVMLSYLPLAHIFDRALEELFLAAGASIGYWRGTIDGVLEDIQALKPTLFIGVPRVFERVYNGVMEKLGQASYFRQGLFKGALFMKQHWMNAGYRWDKATPIADAMIFSKVKERLGGRVRLVACGSAPLAKHVEEFLKVTFCAPVVQGYGLTETCGSSFIAMPTMDMVGSVGGPLPLLEYRLEAIPDMKYNPLSKPPRGEICIRGPVVFQGYFKEPERTAEVMDSEGWFHTGDVGEIGPSGALRIIDRKKSIFKLAQGEYIAPEKIECALAKSQVVAQIYVTGNSLESCLVAIVVPDEAVLRSLMAGAVLPFPKLCASQAAIKAVTAELSAAASAAGLKPFEVPKAILLEPEQWTVENGLQTPTYKLKRPQLQTKYGDAITDMYNTLRKTNTKGL